ncbi:MAG: hypothetical protein DELT_02655 [Desulfovibrio sp.]
MSVRYCDYLFSFISFESSKDYQYIYPCCNIFETSMRPRFTYSGRTFNVSRYRNFIDKTIENLQNNDDLCKDCGFLKSAPNIDELYSRRLKIKHINIAINQGQCHCKCIYCDNGELSINAGIRRDFMPILQTLCDNNLLDESCSASWAGGEPTLVFDFANSCQTLRRLNIYQYFYTNALRPNEEIIKTLIANTGRVYTSIDSGTREMYYKMKGIDGFDKLCSTLSLYAKTPHTVFTKYVMTYENSIKSEIDAFFDLSKKFCDDFVISSVDYKYNFYDNSDIPNKILEAYCYFDAKAELLSIGNLLFGPSSYIINEVARKRFERHRVAAGEKLVFFGGGKAYAQFKHLFEETTPLARLVTMPSALDQEPPGRNLPVMLPEQFFKKDFQARFVVFCSAVNRAAFAKAIEPYLAYSAGKILWCTL